MTAPSNPQRWTRQDFERAARDYWARLPPEHSMESTRQSVQREIAQTALALVGRRRPQARLRYFGELLVQRFHEGRVIQVVPDTMVVLGHLEDRDRTYYDPDEDPPLFMAVEYVSTSNPYGDYTEKRRLYEQALRVPYYLIYDSEAAPLSVCLYRHDGDGYQVVPGNGARRYPIPELDLEVRLLDGWARFWYQGELLPLPVELDARREELERDALRLNDLVRQQSDQLRQRDDQLRQQHDQMSVLAQVVRGLVEGKARLAGRRDILEALPATTDANTLQGWLAELG